MDPRRLLDAWRGRASWLVAITLVGGLAGGVWGYLATPYQLKGRLIRNRPIGLTAIGVGEAGNQISEPSNRALLEMLQSPAFLRRVTEAARLPRTTEEVRRAFALTAVPDTGILTLSFIGGNPHELALLANTCAEEAVRLGQELQSAEVRMLNQVFKQKLAAAEREFEAAGRELVNYQRGAGVADFEKEIGAYLRQQAELDAKAENLTVQVETVDLQTTNLLRELTRQSPALVSAKEALERALQRYTEQHPKVKELRAAVAAVEAQLNAGSQVGPEVAAQGNTVAAGMYKQWVDLRGQKISLAKQLEELNAARQRLERDLRSLPDKQVEYARLQTRHQSLKKRRDLLAGRQQEIQLAEDELGGYVRVLERASLADVSHGPKVRGGVLWAGASGLGALLFLALVVAIREAADLRIRTPADLEQTTGLPLLGALGDLGLMSEEEQQQWAFATFAKLKGRLVVSHQEALICGFTSCGGGEGRSTWIRLLAATARKQGFQVLTIAAEKTATPPPPATGTPEPAEPVEAVAVVGPHEVARVIESGGAPVVRVGLEGWIWDLTRRSQWGEALLQWQAMPGLVVLIELPPARNQEAILLAGTLPQVIWLCARDMAQAAETRAQLETLRHSRANMVGSVFNRARTARGAPRTAALAAGLLWACGLLGQGAAQPTNSATATAVEPAPPKEPGPGTLSVSSPAKLGEWQKRLTVGPGDVFTISLFEQPDSTRSGVFIGPDGRISYLQAQDVEATGLTVDELREKLEGVLGKFFLSPRVVVIPEAFRSKKYYVLGSVVQKGVFPLDHSVTIIEAIARARGFEISAVQRQSQLLADLARGFLMRREPAGAFKRMEVDFEGLFLRGDLSQNVTLAPDDFLYFPPLDLQEVFVLGEVASPGAIPYAPELSTLRAVILRGGFTEKAWRRKVLVVRGSLSRPQTFIVNAADILAAKAADFPLAARDIVYVSRSPWSKVTELLDLAINDYSRAAIIGWTGRNVGPFTKEPFIPEIK